MFCVKLQCLPGLLYSQLDGICDIRQWPPKSDFKQDAAQAVDVKSARVSNVAVAAFVWMVILVQFDVIWEFAQPRRLDMVTGTRVIDNVISPCITESNEERFIVIDRGRSSFCRMETVLWLCRKEEN